LVSKLEMPGEEVGVEMAQEYRLDGEAFCLCIFEVLVDVSLGIDHGRAAAVFIADQV